MTELPRRPIVIWVAQIILLVFGIPLSLIAIFAILRDVTYLPQTNLSIQLVLGFLLGTAFRVGLIVLFFFAFWGLMKRRSYGRWLTVGLIGLLAVFSLLGQFFRTSGPVEYWEYENETQRMGGIFGNLVIYGLIAFFLYRLAFGESVRDFFQQQTDTGETLPPPPESYPL